MKFRYLLAALFSCFLIGCAHQGGPGLTNSGIPNYRPRDLIKVKAMHGGSFSPDGKRYVYFDHETESSHVWIYDLENKTTSLLFFSFGIISDVFWNKQSGDIYYLKFEYFKTQIYKFDLQTRKSSICLEYPWGQIICIEWLKDGAKILCAMRGKEKDKKTFDIYIYDLEKNEKTLVWQNNEKWAFHYYIEDTNQIILSETLGDEKNKLYLKKTDQQDAVPLFNDEKSFYQVVGHALQGDHLYILSNRESDFYEGYRLNLKTNVLTKMISAPWDILDFGCADNQNFFYYLMNGRGKDELHLFSDEFKTEIPVSSEETGQISLFKLECDEKRAAFKITNDFSIGDIHLLDIETGKTQKITTVMPDSLRPDYLVQSEAVTYVSRDGLTMHGYLYVPKQEKPEKGFPALFYIHGGPKNQFVPSFLSHIQYLTNHGYAVFALNVRGSTGYGKSFHLMDNKDFGGAPLLDVLDAKQYLISRPEVDPARIGIMGESFGGYMVLAALAFQPEAFKVGIDVCGPSDLMELVKHFKDFSGSMINYLYEEFGDPEKDAKYLRERSPLFSADRVQAPLIIFQGALDFKVTPDQSKKIYRAIKKRGGKVEYYLYTEEGHGFHHAKNIVHMYKKILSFLKCYL